MTDGFEYNGTLVLDYDTNRRCPEHTFSCLSGECIQDVYVCDEKIDCLDGSDELICNGRKKWLQREFYLD